MLGDVHNHGIAPCPSQRIVDLVKAVEVNQGEGDDPGTTLRQCIIKTLNDCAVIGQSGQCILTEQLVRRLATAIERAQQLSRSSHGKKTRNSKHGADRRQQAPHPVDSANERVIGDPAEPADDPAPRVVQRLQLAPCPTGGASIKPQVLKPGAMFDEPKLRIVDVIDIADRCLKFIKRPSQCGVLLDLDVTCVEPGDCKTNRRAKDQGAGQQRRQEKHEAGRPGAFVFTDWGPHRGARKEPPRRQPFRGCRSGRHYSHAPSNKRPKPGLSFVD